MVYFNNFSHVTYPNQSRFISYFSLLFPIDFSSFSPASRCILVKEDPMELVWSLGEEDPGTSLKSGWSLIEEDPKLVRSVVEEDPKLVWSVVEEDLKVVVDDLLLLPGQRVVEGGGRVGRGLVPSRTQSSGSLRLKRSGNIISK